MRREADKCIAEIEHALPGYFRCADLRTVGYQGSVTILAQQYEAVISEACALLRGRYATRARAIELAFDFTLRKAVGTEWERTGEVHVNKADGKVRALCVLNEGGKETSGRTS